MRKICVRQGDAGRLAEAEHQGLSARMKRAILKSSGTDKVKYYINFAANGENDIYKHSANRYDQFGIRANLDFKLSQYVSLTYGNTSRYEYTQYPAKSAGSIFSAIRRSKPTLNAYWPSGEIGPDIEFGDNPAATSTDAAGYNRQKNYYIQNNATLTIQFPWVEGLIEIGRASCRERV